MDQEIRNGKEIWTENGRAMEIMTEFETGNFKCYVTRNIIFQREVGKTREYRQNKIQKALFSTGNGKNTRTTDTGKMRYNMIWRNEILEKF